MKKLICTFIAVMIIFSAGVSAQAQEELDICNELKIKIESMVGPEKAKGAVLSIVKNGKIELCTGFGFANESYGIEADGEKKAFRIGSVSKTFAAVAAQILHQEGRLDMDCDISKYLGPEYLRLSYRTTMHQLLTHTAGFEDMVTGMAVFNVSDTEPLAESVVKYKPAQVYKPGTVVSYSNYGIALAAYVVESISGQSFDDYCREQIFMPLDMNRTTFKHMHDVVYVSKPYLPSGRETLEPYMNLYPEGSAVSTAEDMGKYMLWLLNGEDTRILSKKSKEELFSRQFSMSKELEGVGYAWNRKARNNQLYYDKKGETLNFYTRIALYPQKQTGIFLSFNTYLPEDEINEIMTMATDLLYGKTSKQSIPSSKATFNIKGSYVNNWSSFKTPEKILNYVIPGKMLKVSGTQNSGFLLKGEKMTLIGEDTYSTPIGILKFLKRDGKIMIATESAITYLKVSQWQNKSFQMLIPLLYFAITIISLIRELFLMLRRKRKQYDVLSLPCSLIQLLSFVMLCFLMYKGITSFSLLVFALPMKICGWIILAASAAGIWNWICINSKYNSVSLILTVWNIASILFCIWMFGMNIL